MLSAISALKPQRWKEFGEEHRLFVAKVQLRDGHIACPATDGRWLVIRPASCQDLHPEARSSLSIAPRGKALRTPIRDPHGGPQTHHRVGAVEPSSTRLTLHQRLGAGEDRFQQLDSLPPSSRRCFVFLHWDQPVGYGGAHLRVRLDYSLLERWHVDLRDLIDDCESLL
jgi:hypothetical protein